jgi:hypothetical protein
MPGCRSCDVPSNMKFDFNLRGLVAAVWLEYYYSMVNV